MRILIGIDDTDNLESRGTGHLTRQLGQRLAQAGLARLLGITRHQLLVSPEIPYTSHNSSACLDVELQPGDQAAAADFCRRELETESAPGADAGLCFAVFKKVNSTVQDFGGRAKTTVLTLTEAYTTARAAGILLEGLTGNRGGAIGALAAVGLRQAGSDGRFLYLPGLRDPQEVQGRVPAHQLYNILGPNSLRTLSGGAPAPEDWVTVGDWPRPLLQGGQAVLFVEEDPDNGSNEWRIISKESIKQLSQ